MATDMKRVMLSISPDLEQELDVIKKEQFYNKSYAELYRYVLALGLKAATAKENAANGSQETR